MCAQPQAPKIAALIDVSTWSTNIMINGALCFVHTALNWQWTPGTHSWPDVPESRSAEGEVEVPHDNPVSMLAIAMRTTKWRRLVLVRKVLA